MKYTVQIGFGILILLMILSTVGVLYQTHVEDAIIDNLVEVSSAKIDYAYTMRDSIRRRDTKSATLIASVDPFEKDQLILEIYALAGIYRAAREKLLALPKNEHDLAIHQRLTELSRKTQPLTRRFTELVQEEVPHSELLEAYHAAREARAPMYPLVDELVQIQRQFRQRAQQENHASHQETRWLIVLIATICILLSLFIATFVTRLVARKNRQLLQKNASLIKANDGAEEAMRAKSAFMATMSHEIRTPITAIIGFAESTFFSNQNMEMRQKSVKNIIHSARHLLQIINDILDLSKIEANRLDIETLPVSPFVVMNEAEALLSALAKDKGLAFGVNYICPLPEVIMSDPLRLKQIILNLCSNSIKFTDNGHVHINVKHDANNKKLIIEVVDSGIGLSKDQIGEIFEPFRQVDSSTSRRYGGTGLGLSLSRDMAKALGGELQVESEPGKGSCFRLTIDSGASDTTSYVNSLNEIPEERNENINVMAGANLHGKVLVVEDNIFNQELVTILLERLGLESEIAEHGRIAVEKAQLGDYDLILMDIQMPVMDGIEATMALRELGYTIPIVALSANAMTEDKKKCMDAGCDDFLTKPIDTQKFFAVLSHYLKRHATDSAAGVKKPEPLYSTRLQQDPTTDKAVKVFIGEKLPHILQQIEHAIQTKDWEQLKAQLHQLKSAGGNTGFMDYFDVAQKMEFQILNQDPHELLRLLDELHTLYLRCAAGLEIPPVRLVDDNQINTSS